MLQARIDRHTHRLEPPDNWDAEKAGPCNALFIRAEATVGGPQYLKSAWEAEPREAHMLLAGAKLILSLQGTSHPVTGFHVDELPEDATPVMTVRQVTKLDGSKKVRVDMLYPTGRMIFSEVNMVDRSLPIAVAQAIEAIEAMAKREGLCL